MRLPLVGQSYASRSLALAAQESINVFPERAEDVNEKGKGGAMLVGCPGRHLFYTCTLGGCRATWSGGGRLFIIDGPNLIELDSAGAVISSNAGLSNDSLPAEIFSNGNQLLIVSAGRAYCDNGAGPVAITIDNSAGVVSTNGTTVTWVSGDKFLSDGTWTGRAITINAVGYTISSVTNDKSLVLTGTAGVQTSVVYSVAGAALTAVRGAYLDGYFIVQRPAGGTPDLGRQFNISAILNGLSWNGLDFANKEGYPDHTKAITVDNQQLYLWGDETFEVWQNTGNARFPFERIQGGMQRYGTFGTNGFCNASLDGKVFLLGGDDHGAVSAYVLDGFTPRRVSTFGVEHAFKAAGVGVSPIAYTYLEEGHSFWVINFGSVCYAYDATTGAWHRRARWSGSVYAIYGNHFHTYLPEFVWQCHIVGALGGNIYKSSIDYYDDAGADIKWSRALPYQYNEGKKLYYGRIDLDCETGTVASGAAPNVTLDYSDDRGQTFANPRTASLGVHNAFSVRVFWNRNGASDVGRVWRLSGIGQSKVALIDLDCEITPGGV